MKGTVSNFGSAINSFTKSKYRITWDSILLFTRYGGEHLPQIGISNEMKHVDAFENAYAIKNDMDNWKKKEVEMLRNWLSSKRDF